MDSSPSIEDDMSFGFDEEEAEYGDFQTCDSLSSKEQQQQFDENFSSKTSIDRNYFDGDWNQFRKFRNNFQRNIENFFDCKSNNDKTSLFGSMVTTQEDLIMNSLIWYNLTNTGDLQSSSQFDFNKKLVYSRFLDIFPFNNNEKTIAEQDDSSPPVDLKKNTKNNNGHNDNDNILDEQYIAKCLDIHSMIFETTTDETCLNDDVYSRSEDVIETNKTYQQNNSNHNISGDRYNNKFNDENQSLLSLNASTLLQTFHNDFLYMNPNERYDVDAEMQNDTPEDDQDSQFYSLPVDLNNLKNSTLNDQRNRNNQDYYYTTIKSFSKPSKIEFRRLVNGDGCDYLIDNIPFIRTGFDKEKLSKLLIKELNEKVSQLEYIIQLQSDQLQFELCTRNEQEYEKELKNQFISLLLKVQNKRRRHLKKNSNNIKPILVNRETNSNKIAIIKHLSLDGILPMFNSNSLIKRNNEESNVSSQKQQQQCENSTRSVFITTILPYTDIMFPLDVSTLHILIEILDALDKDSSNVPELIANYILKVICPA